MNPTYVLGWAVLAVLATSAIGFAAKRHLVTKMNEAFELGLKLGSFRANVGQEWLDSQLRDCGFDPAHLPGRDD
jgi:hypothetical protein